MSPATSYEQLIRTLLVVGQTEPTAKEKLELADALRRQAAAARRPKISYTNQSS